MAYIIIIGFLIVFVPLILHVIIFIRKKLPGLGEPIKVNHTIDEHYFENKRRSSSKIRRFDASSDTYKKVKPEKYSEVRELSNKMKMFLIKYGKG